MYVFLFPRSGLSLPSRYLLAPLLSALSGLYGVTNNSRSWLFDRGVLCRAALSVPTISIGNITHSGTGAHWEFRYSHSQFRKIAEVGFLSHEATGPALTHGGRVCPLPGLA